MKYVGRILISTFLILNALLMLGCGNSAYSEENIPAAAGRFGSVTTEYPGVVMVIAPLGRGLCSGSIISRYAVLTAAHCLLDSGVYTVRTNSGEFRTSTKELHGPGVVDDPNDIGILIFDEEITSTDSEVYGFGSSASPGDSVAVVGFGCTSIEKRTGAGLKRAGTNRIADKDDYLVLLTPKNSVARGIIGDVNQSGTCFGDSGGPLFKMVGAQLELVGVTHAGGTYSSYYVSEFVNVADNSSNRNFIRDVSVAYGFSVAGI